MYPIIIILTVAGLAFYLDGKIDLHKDKKTLKSWNFHKTIKAHKETFILILLPIVATAMIIAPIAMKESVEDRINYYISLNE